MRITKDTQREVTSVMDRSDMSWARGAVIGAITFLVGFIGLIVVLIVATSFWWIPVAVIGIGAVIFITSAVIGMRKVKSKGINMAQLGYQTLYGDREEEETAPFINSEDETIAIDTVETADNNEHIETMEEQPITENQEDNK